MDWGSVEEAVSKGTLTIFLIVSIQWEQWVWKHMKRILQKKWYSEEHWGHEGHLLTSSEVDGHPPQLSDAYKLLITLDPSFLQRERSQYWCICLSSLLFSLQAPSHYCLDHYWINAAQRCWRGNTLLLVCDIPENFRLFFWYKGLIIVNRNETVQNVITTNNNILGAHSVDRSQDISQLFRLA